MKSKKINRQQLKSNKQSLKKSQIKQLKNQPKNTNESWLKTAWKNAKKFVKDIVKDIKKNAKKIYKQIKKDFTASKDKKKFKPGSMVAFRYYAKDKQKRWDRNPLILCLGWSKTHPKTHFYGLNVHWMKGGTNERVAFASFFVELLDKRNGKLVYEDVKPFLKKYKGSPVLRMYIYKNVSGKVIDMPTEQYLTAAALPTEKWMGG